MKNIPERPSDLQAFVMVTTVFMITAASRHHYLLKYKEIAMPFKTTPITNNQAGCDPEQVGYIINAMLNSKELKEHVHQAIHKMDFLDTLILKEEAADEHLCMILAESNKSLLTFRAGQRRYVKMATIGTCMVESCPLHYYCPWGSTTAKSLVRAFS